jgi:hypothetical protein
LLLLLLLLIVSSACTGGSALQRVVISGKVLAGPSCPVERPGRSCPPTPIQVGVEARDAPGHAVTHGETGTDGHFSLQVRPGTYRIRVLVTAALPRCLDTTVVATRDRTVAILCDSGIR